MMVRPAFDINRTPCGQLHLRPLCFAVGGEGDPYDLDAVRRILRSPGVDVCVLDAKERSVLWAQCFLARNPVVKLLLADARVDVNAPGVEGSTPLRVAAFMGNVHAVKLLLADARVDPNLPNNEGEGGRLAIVLLCF